MSSFPFGPQTPPKNVARILHWLMVEFDRLITTHKERLPQKSKKAGYSCFIWVEAPQHDNFNNNTLRQIFNDGLAIVGNLHENVSVLGMKKIWDPSDYSLFLKKENRYSATGLRFFWESVDKTIRYADTIQFKKMTQQKSKNKVKPVFSPVKAKSASKVVKVTHKQKNLDYDHYHWHSSSRRREEQNSTSSSERGDQYRPRHRH